MFSTILYDVEHRDLVRYIQISMGVQPKKI